MGRTGARLLLLAVTAIVTGLALAGDARPSSADVMVPAFGSFYTNKSTITSNAGEESDPFHDLANDCNFNYPLAFNPNFPSLINYLSITEDGTMYGECKYTDNYFGVTERQDGSFTGMMNVQTGAFSGVVINTRSYQTSGDTPTKQTFSITLEISGGMLGANNFATGTATFQFNYSCTGGCGDKTSDSYSGTIVYNLSTKPANAADLTIDHIEVVQVIQDVGNGVPLVAHKSTAVRVFPRANALVTGAKVKLLYEGDEVATAPTDVTPDASNREEASLTANFLLPFGLTAAGEVTLTAEVMPPDGWSDTDESNDSKSVNVNFQSRGGLFVDYIKVCHQPGGQGVVNCPLGDVSDVHLFAQDVFPLADGALDYNALAAPPWVYTGPLSTAQDEVAFLAALRKRFDFSTTSESLADQVMAWLPAGLGIEDGAADPKWDTIGGLGRVFYLEKQNLDATSLGVAFAHEIAHNLGRRHPSSDGGCGAIDAGNTDWPYADATIQEVGFWIRRSMIMPHTSTDLMSYCSNRWISPHTYMRLFNGNFTAQSVSTQGVESTFLIVSGTAQAAGGGTLDPAYQVAMGGAGPASNPNGNTCLRFSGAAGDLGDFCFDLTFTGGENGVLLTEEPFTLKVALPAGATRVALLREGVEVDALQASGAAPSLSVDAPAGDWTTGNQTLAWSAPDADGDPVLYTVLYSPDGGAAWLPIEVDTPASQFTFDVSTLEASEEGMFRVLASDGLNTSVDTTPPVQVGQIAPKGDVDCSGGRTSVDALVVLQLASNLVDSAPCEEVGDVNCDMDVNSLDALFILQDISGFDVSLPPGCPPFD